MGKHHMDGASKARDPVQSFEAGEDAVSTGLTSKHYTIIMAVMNKRPDRDLTNMDIAHFAGLNQNQITRRMSELERIGLVRRGVNRKCIHLGRMVGTWIKCP